MKPILITLTEYKSGLERARTLNVNHIVTMQTTLIRTGHNSTLLELMGENPIRVLESQQQIKALVDQATHYS